MCTNNLQSYCDLQLELENAKDKLVTLNENIKRIIGRSPKMPRDIRSNEVKRSETDKKLNKFSQETFSSKKKSKSVFKRLSSPILRCNDAESRPKLTSRVIRELPSRKEIVAAQSADSESRARNRRMFGSLLGTLHKFCQEESRLKQKEEKKAQIEKKLEEQEILERESLKRERETLFIDRKRKQIEIKRLESKISRIKDFEMWENSTGHLKNFIKTKTNPSIFYRPKVLTKKTEKLLIESSNDVEKTIEKKKITLQVDILKEETLEFQELEDETSVTLNKMFNVSETPRIKQQGLASSVCVMDDTKCDHDSKENKIRNSGEFVLNSSVVVVNH